MAASAFKGLFSGLRQSLPTEVMKNVISCYKHFVFETFTFSSSLFGYVVKQVHKKAMVICKIWDVTNWKTNNYNRHILLKVTRQ